MKLVFKYDLKKDTENFLKSFKSKNSQVRTKLEEKYLNEIGELDEEKVSKFLSEQGIDIQAELTKISHEWSQVEEEMISRMEKLFEIRLENLPTAYLSTNSRCTYSTEGNYFFVKMTGGDSNRNIAHELLHFYTWHAFYKDLESKGVSKEKFNDVKESLTELLNTDFKDLVKETDIGYPQHKDLRNKVKVMRLEGNNVGEIVTTLAT